MSRESYTELCRAFLYSTDHAGMEPGKKAVKKGPVITISRAAGARGNSIADALVKRLESDKTIPGQRPWTLFNQNLIQHVIEEHKLPEKTEDYFPEDKPDEISSFVAEVLGLHRGVYNTMVKTAETIRRIAKAGNAVIVGRGGNLITSDLPDALHIRLVGSEPFRIRHYSKHFGLTETKAASEIERLDRARKRFIKSHFDKNIDDAVQYDLVLNTDSFTNEQAVDLLVSALHAKLA
jgi:hypothetical protein